MTSRSHTLLTLGVLLATSFALAADTIEIALRDVHEGLEPLGSYRQHHIVTKQVGGLVTIHSEWMHTQLASGDKSSLVTNPLFGQTTSDYLAGGKAYTYTQMGEEGMCFAMPAWNGSPLDAVIGDLSDLTGLHSATLQERGVVINETISDHYRFDPSRRGSTNESWDISGDVWLAQTGYIIRYVVEVDTGEELTRWEYNAVPIEPLETIAVPSACTGE